VPTVVAMLMELIGTAMSVLGNEMAVRIGRQRWVMGLILDSLGGESMLNWGIGFAHLAVVMIIGPVALKLLKPEDLKGDRHSQN